MRTLIIILVVSLFCNHFTYSNESDSLRSFDSKIQLLHWLDSSSQSLNSTNLSSYVDVIEYSLDSLTNDQTIHFLSRALNYSEEEELSTPKIYYRLAEEYYSKMAYDSTIFYADKLLALSKKAEPRHLALALEVKASSLLRTQNYAAVSDLLAQNKEFLINQFPNNYLYIFNLLLYSYMVTSRYDDVIRESQEAIELAQKIGDYTSIILLRNKIAAAHKNNKNYETARRYLLQSLKIVEEHPDQSSEVYVNFDLGLLYRDLGNLDSAIIYTKKAISLMTPLNKNNYLVQLATFYADNGQYNETKHLLDSIDVSKLFDHTAQGEFLYAKGIMLEGFGSNNLAIAALDSALVLRSGAPREIVRLKQALSRLKQKTGGYNEALELYKQADIIEDSLFSLEKQKVIAKLEAQHQLSEKEKEIYELETTATRNQILLISAIGLVVLLALIAFLSIRSYKLKRKANEILSIKNKSLKTLRERENQLAEATIHAKERQLATMAMAAHEKNSLLQDLEQKVSLLEKKLNNELTPDFKDLKKTISNSFSIDDSWENFHHHFQDVHPLFFENLKQINASLSNDDLKLSAYLKIGMSNKEIASVIHLTVGSVKTKVNRLKKKLEMGPDDNLRNFMFNNN
ncbi:MAG: tetratricopeptide repeat protein [Reichenbachiella sp.]|uniref:tetratricopeptide repeat protein n=1 Tax=Reichenbachiella sp. TaxID=2184521 RepID=UPI00329A25F5